MLASRGTFFSHVELGLVASSCYDCITFCYLVVITGKLYFVIRIWRFTKIHSLSSRSTVANIYLSYLKHFSLKIILEKILSSL